MLRLAVAPKDRLDGETRKLQNFAATSGDGFHLLAVDRLGGELLHRDRRADDGGARPRADSRGVGHMIEILKASIST
jgi:hypothetical protein